MDRPVGGGNFVHFKVKSVTSVASSADMQAQKSKLPVMCPGLQSPLYAFMRSVKKFSTYYETVAGQTV